MKNKNRKKLRLRPKAKEVLTNILGVALFYAVLIAGVFFIDARFKDLDNQKSADVVVTQTAQNINR